MNTIDLSKITVSVIVPTKNEEQVISECLSSVFNQSLKPLEVIIVDGRSTDNTLAKTRQFPVKTFVETEPSSLPHARNLGIENAKGEVIFVMDADVILDKDCIKNAVKHFTDINVVAVIPSELNIAHTRLEKIEIDWLRGTANPIRMGIGISSFAEFFRKTVFEEINFDPELGYGEDADFQRKLERLCGDSMLITHSKNSTISLHHPHTFKELWSQWTWYGRTFTKYLLKHISMKTLMNLGSLLAPVIILILSLLTLFFIQVFPFLIVIFALLVARNLIACIRARSLSFFQFLAFEFIRSIMFTNGLLQGLFSKKRGK